MIILAKRHLKWILSISLLLCLNSVILPQEQDEETLQPQFDSSDVILLTAVPHERSVISSQGRYVAGMLEDTVHSPDSITVHLWDLGIHDDISYKSIVISVDPSAPGNAYPVLDFSPDEKYLAILQHTRLTILTLPELETQKKILINRNFQLDQNFLAWSPDSQLIAYKMDFQILAYDVRTDDLYENTAHVEGDIVAYQDGWVTMYHPLLTNPYWLFAACTRFLEQCESYNTQTLPSGQRPSNGSGNPIRVSPNAQHIFLAWQEEGQIESSVWRWQRGNDPITYIQDERPMAELAEILPFSFSNDGNYLVSYSNPLKYRSGILEIREAGDGTPIQSFTECDWQSDLPNNSYYFLLSCPSDSGIEMGVELRIYHLSQMEPVSTVKLEGLVNVNECPIGSIAPGLCSLHFFTANFSNDGSRLLVFSRGRSMIIPIEYAPATIDD